MFDVLIAYTDWERSSWFDWFRRNGDALAASTGPNGDGRFQTIGEVVRHIFSAEARYADRVANRPLTDSNVIPAGNLDALIDFARTSRASMNELIATFAEWDTGRDFKIGNLEIHATPRKIVLHALMHEIRHWAQIGTILRLNRFKVEPHDLLVSPVADGS